MCGPVEAGSVGVTVKDSKVNVRDVIVPIQSFQAPTLINFLSRRWEAQRNDWELRT